MAYVLDDEFLWGGLYDYPRRSFNPQPEKKKRKYVKSGRYAKKKKAAQAMMQLVETLNNTITAEQQRHKNNSNHSPAEQQKHKNNSNHTPAEQQRRKTNSKTQLFELNPAF